MRQSVIWKPVAEEFLRDNFRRLRNDQLARKLGMSVDAIKGKLRRSGLRRRLPRADVGRASPKPPQITPDKPHGYSEETIAWATENATTGPNCEARMILAHAGMMRP
jgi:hypothetical protein